MKFKYVLYACVLTLLFLTTGCSSSADSLLPAEVDSVVGSGVTTGQAGNLDQTSNIEQAQISFDWFEYRGDDAVFAPPVGKHEFQNPIVSGFYPDPSITRRGSDYYMVNSSFGYLPGLPIWHSRNLVNWKLIGHGLNRPGQLDMAANGGIKATYGLFAPTLRYHDGLFYLINTAVYSGGNFIITANDPAGPWSDPNWLPEIGGIDPDIFFDDDGKTYIVHNTEPLGGVLYDGHRAIWLWQYDLESAQVVPNSGRQIVDGGADISKKPIWIEGPHLYKVDGWYYLTCAEGGTGVNHSQVVFRTASLDKPFQPYAGNPILTQRDLPTNRMNPINATGHADLIQTPEGQWWAVFLATRSYHQKYHNTGRETFLLPVRWRDGWPHILDKGETLPYRLARPKTGETLPDTDSTTGNFIWRDEFNRAELNPHWINLRSLQRQWLSLSNGVLQLSPRQDDLNSLGRPAYIGYRQKHQRFRVETQLLPPTLTGVSAGVVAFQNENHHYYMGVRRINNGYELFLEKASGAKPEQLISKVLAAKPNQALILGINGDRGVLDFHYRWSDEKAQALAVDQDGKNLSTEIAGGFLGVTLGIHSRVE